MTPSDSLQFFTEAAPSVGFGGLYNYEWFTDTWPTELHYLDYRLRVIACLLWVSHWYREANDGVL